MPNSVIQPLSLHTLRERARLSIAELANRCGVDRTTVYGWASKRNRMRADDVRNVSKALGLNDADDLAFYRWAAEPPSPSSSTGDPPEGESSPS